jgi:hypothetical protein
MGPIDAQILVVKHPSFHLNATREDGLFPWRRPVDNVMTISTGIFGTQGQGRLRRIYPASQRDDHVLMLF